jgi:DNA polymerase-3 subunit epsilon
MRVLCLDTETTGLQVDTDRPFELGTCLWDIELKAPLLIKNTFIDLGDITLSQEVKDVTGVREEWLKEFGVIPQAAYISLNDQIKYHKPDFLVGHNLVNFDRPMLLAEYKRLGLPTDLLAGLPVIDTRTDLPFEKEPSSRRLVHLTTDHGFLNPFPHRAITDVLSTLKLLSFYDFDKVVEQSKIPFITVRALVDYDSRQLAKDQRFSWEKVGDKTYPKMWCKQIRENQLEAERVRCKDFKVVQIA